MDAMILLAHGARVAGWAVPFHEIRDRLAAMRPGTPVSLAFLEFIEPGFETACARLVDAGATRIVVCPLFLGVGGHVAADLPRLFEAARARWPALSIACAPTLGEDAGVLQAIAAACARHAAAPRQGP